MLTRGFFRLIAVSDVGDADALEAVVVRIGRAVLNFQVNADFIIFGKGVKLIPGRRVDARFNKLRNFADDLLWVNQTAYFTRIIADAKHDMPAKAVGKCRNGFQPAARLFDFQCLFVVNGGTLQE